MARFVECLLRCETEKNIDDQMENQFVGFLKKKSLRKILKP